VDAERASGYRFSQRAYLVQLRREGYGTVLIDPIALPDLSQLNDALADVEWILHAAHQDLPCLAEIGMRPRRLFDTELAGRLLGEERVALGTMVESRLGIRLEKGHSAADWSTRPLPYDWLVYAALDVELLVPLRDQLATELADAGKSAWAEQEFEASRLAPPPPPRPDPWRRTSGIHAIDELVQLPVFGGPRQRRHAARWLAALSRGRDEPDSDLPTPNLVSADWMPPPARWRERFPEAADRLVACRDVISALTEKNSVLAQNLLAGDVVRRLAWEPPPELTVGAVAARLAALGARQWQVELTAGPLTAALLAPPPVVAEADPLLTEPADEPEPD